MSGVHPGTSFPYKGVERKLMEEHHPDYEDLSDEDCKKLIDQKPRGPWGTHAQAVTEFLWMRLQEEKRAAATAEAHARTALQQFRDAKDIPEEDARKLFTGMAGGASEARYREAGLEVIEAFDKMRADTTELLEGVLGQVGYTCMGAYEDIEEYLGVEWSGEKQKFVYPDGKVID